MNRGREIWRNKLIWVMIIGGLVITSISVISIREPDKSTVNSRSPIFISPYVRDYALLVLPARIESKTYKIKGNGSCTGKVIFVENKKIVSCPNPGQISFYRNLRNISICFADIEIISQSWSGYACSLLGLPPPPPPAVQL